MKKIIQLLLITGCTLSVFAKSVDDLRMGCNYATAIYPNARKKLSSDQKKLMDEFVLFMKSGAGADLLPLVLAGETGSQADEEYLPMVKAFAFSLGRDKRAFFRNQFADLTAPCAAAVKKTSQRGQAALKKGYLQQNLTDADEQALADYAILSAITRTGAKILPTHIGLSKPKSRGRINYFKPAEPAPDFCLRTMEDALQSPAYSDIRVSDPTAFLKPDAVEALTRLFEDYRPASGGKVTHNLPKEKEGFLKRSSFQGKKPMLLLLADPVDCYHPQVQAMLEPLKRACGDQIEFLLIHVSIHDARMKPVEYFGPLQGGKALSLHPENEEQRARTAKLLYMRYPNSTIPCVLDNDSQTTRNDWSAQGGDARITLIDLDGNVAYDSPASWFYWSKGNYSSEVMEVNEVEREVLALLANGGKANPERKEFTPTGQRFAPPEPGGPDRDAENYGYTKHLWFCGKIDTVDSKTKKVTVTRLAPDAAELPGLQFIQQAGKTAELDEQAELNFQTLEKWVKEGKAVRTFRLEDSVALFRNGRIATVADLQPGDVVGAYYNLNDDGSGTITPEQFRATRLP